jgi:hypothetical protein
MLTVIKRLVPTYLMIDDLDGEVKGKFTDQAHALRQMARRNRRAVVSELRRLDTPTMELGEEYRDPSPYSLEPRD